jgi:hypothetical protein
LCHLSQFARGDNRPKNRRQKSQIRREKIFGDLFFATGLFWSATLWGTNYFLQRIPQKLSPFRQAIRSGGFEYAMLATLGWVLPFGLHLVDVLSGKFFRECAGHATGLRSIIRGFLRCSGGLAPRR